METTAEAASETRPRLSASLPAGFAWERAWDPQFQQNYFFCRETGERTWTKPDGMIIDTTAAPRGSAAEVAAEKNPDSSKGKQDAPNENLLDGWEAAWDPKHLQHYYYKLETQERTWIKPERRAVAEAPTPPTHKKSLSHLPDGWEEAVDQETGCTFYFRSDTGQSQWHPPVLLPRIEELAAASASTALIPAENQEREHHIHATGSHSGLSKAAIASSSRGQGSGGQQNWGRMKSLARARDRDTVDPMDPSSYSDAPRGGWGAGLMDASSRE